MVVITMEKITSLIKKLDADAKAYPHLHSLTFTKGELFSWNHHACAISYMTSMPSAEAYLLHEYGHALLDHKQYKRDIELLRMEREAWDVAANLADGHEVPVSEELVESSLDSYRDWLHTRSTCPECSATGLQVEVLAYQCISCHNRWRVNEARNCALRRYPLKKHS